MTCEQWILILEGGTTLSASDRLLVINTWNAAIAAEQELMGCGHPKECWGDEDSYSPINGVNMKTGEGQPFGHCTWCAERERHEAELETKRKSFEAMAASEFGLRRELGGQFLTIQRDLKYGGFDFGVRCAVCDLTVEEMHKFREMIVVAIGVVEDMWRRDQEIKNPASQAMPPDPQETQ